MVATVDDSDNRHAEATRTNSPNSSPLSSEIHEVLAALREEVTALRDEVQTLREASERPEGLLNRKEAAERLGISTRTLDDMAEAGEIQPVRIRNRVLYAPETLDAYIRRRAGGGDK